MARSSGKDKSPTKPAKGKDKAKPAADATKETLEDVIDELSSVAPGAGRAAPVTADSPAPQSPPPEQGGASIVALPVQVEVLKRRTNKITQERDNAAKERDAAVELANQLRDKIKQLEASCATPKVLYFFQSKFCNCNLIFAIEQNSTASGRKSTSSNKRFRSSSRESATSGTELTTRALLRTGCGIA